MSLTTCRRTYFHCTVTDCSVLIGTNDLWAMNTDQITSRMSTLIDSLSAHCRVWLSTLVPKERTTGGDYEVVRTRRGKHHGIHPSVLGHEVMGEQAARVFQALH